MNKQEGGRARLRARAAEVIRKRLVYIKRNPQVFPLATLLAAFLLFSLNLTDISNTTAKIQGRGMGLSQFTVMLFSILSLVCLINAFPRRKKTNLPMLLLALVMMGVMVYCDIYYAARITAAVTRAESPIPIGDTTRYIEAALNMLRTHRILIYASAALLLAMPFYSRLLKRINTSVSIEESASIKSIDLSELG